MHQSLNSNTVSTSELEVKPDDDDTLLDALVKRYVEYTMYYSLIDSVAAEHSCSYASDGCSNQLMQKRWLKSLTVKYNKARQESITTELIEIISGVESMK